MSGTFEKKVYPEQGERRFEICFLDPIITQDCLIQMNKNVKHCSLIKRGTRQFT